MRHCTHFSAFQAKLDQDEKNNLRRPALQVEAESPRESFDTSLTSQQRDLMVVIEGSNICMEHPTIYCHSWLAACRAPSPLHPPHTRWPQEMPGTSGTLQAFWRHSCSACRNFEYKTEEGWLDKACRGPTGAESVSRPRKFNPNNHRSLRLSSAGYGFSLKGSTLLGLSPRLRSLPHGGAQWVQQCVSFGGKLEIRILWIRTAKCALFRRSLAFVG